MFKGTHLTSSSAQNISQLPHLTQVETKGLIMSFKAVMVKLLAEADVIHKGLPEESIIMGPFAEV